ncbi:MAG: UbiA family prenyltransferase [Candidatus Anstonellaceae archaeon]
MQKADAYWRLFRIEHAFMLSFAVLLAILVSSQGKLPPYPMLFAALAVPFFIEMGSFALNDCLDVKTDRENRRQDRPVATGEISQKSAFAASAVCYILGVGLAFALPQPALYIALAFSALSVAYNFKLKDMPAIGNAYIAASMAVPFVFGNLVASDRIMPSMLAIASVAFAAGFGREIVKSAEDLEGDVKHRGSKTLPAILGKKASLKIASAFYLISAALALLPFAAGLRANTLSVGMVALAAISFAYLAKIVWDKHEIEELRMARKASLLVLAIGLLGYAASLI